MKSTKLDLLQTTVWTLWFFQQTSRSWSLKLFQSPWILSWLWLNLELQRVSSSINDWTLQQVHRWFWRPIVAATRFVLRTLKKKKQKSEHKDLKTLFGPDCSRRAPLRSIRWIHQAMGWKRCRQPGWSARPHSISSPSGSSAPRQLGRKERKQGRVKSKE